MAAVWRQADAQILSTVHTFDNGSDGGGSQCTLLLSGSVLYGTNEAGGAYGQGVVYSMPATGGSVTTLCALNGAPNGYTLSPTSLTLVGSTLYGMTSDGGANYDGSIFSVPVTGGAPTTLLSFTGTNGACPGKGPSDTLTLVGSTLYGTTRNGGTDGDGNVFCVNTDGSGYQDLLDFSGANGKNPYAGLTLVGSTFYGTTAYGGSNGFGNVFSMPMAGGAATTLCTFNYNSTGGYNPRGNVTIIGSTLYATNYAGGAGGYGTVFSIPLGGGIATSLLNFSGANGENPSGSLTLVGSTFYGTTQVGGSNGAGVIFSLPLSGGTAASVSLTGSSNGSSIQGSLTLNGSTLYGTTWNGGANNCGTVFGLNIAPATAGLSALSNATIISGGTATLGMTVSNSPSSGYNLNYTLGAAVQSGIATLGAITPSTGSLAPNASQSCTVAATSTTLGVTTISVTGSDPNATNSPQTTTGTLTVLGHAVPSLAVTSGNNQTVIVGATGIAAGLTLSNGTLGQTWLAALDVSSLGLSVTGSTGGKLVASGSTESYVAALSTGTQGTQNEAFSLNVGDDHTLSGASSPMNISTTATLTVLGHSVPSLRVASGNNQSVFVGASAITAGLSLADSGTNLSPLDVNTLGGLSGSTGTAVVLSGGAGAYTAVLSTSTAGLSQSQAFSLKAGDQQSLPGASALGTLTQSVTGLNVYNHAAGALSGGTTLTITPVIVGYPAPVSSNTLTVTNTAASPGGAIQTTGSSSLAGVTLNNVSNVAASGGTGSLSVTLAVGQGVGAFSQNNLTLTYADASTYSGALGNLGTTTVTITGNVFDHASGSASGTTIGLPDSIVGYVGALSGLSSASVSNASGDRVSLKTTGGTSAGFVTVNNVNGVAPGTSANIAAAANLTGSQSIGAGALHQTFNLTYADDSTLSGASPSTGTTSIIVTGNVLDHSNASLSSSATQTSQTINFGNVLKGANIPGQAFTIYNVAANTTAAYTANLKLTGAIASVGDPALTTNLAPFNGLAAGAPGNPFTASLNTGNYTTTGITTITLSASQLADDSALPGAGKNNSGALTVTLQGNVGNATADASNSPAAFGSPLTAAVAQNASYANLESTVMAAAGVGGGGMVGSTATILAGVAGVSTTASMAWRTAAVGEGLVSDVVDLSGIGIVDGQTKNGSVHTDTFVLQMTYDPQGVEARTGLSELAAAAGGFIQMDYLDEASGDSWKPAVRGNFGSTSDEFVGVGAWNSSEMTLGDWGVNTVNHTVWAVLDHNSQFAVVPEPSTLALLGIGAIVLIGYRGRRKSAKGTAQAEFQDDVPVILSFPSHSSPAIAARRAA